MVGDGLSLATSVGMTGHGNMQADGVDEEEESYENRHLVWSLWEW